jgi:hypothetical protein
VTQGVYALLLKNGLHYKPSSDDSKDILAAATGENALEKDVELSKLNIHACVSARCSSARLRVLTRAARW